MIAYIQLALEVAAAILIGELVGGLICYLLGIKEDE